MLTLADIAKEDTRWRKMANYLGARGTDIDDAVQTMYLKLGEIQEREGSLERMAAPSGVNTLYIFKIMQSAVVDIFRERNRTFDSLDEFCPIDAPQHAEHKYAELMERIRECINEMRDYDQMMLELYFVYGHSFREIEARTGIPTHSIFNTVKNAKQIIKANSKHLYHEYIQTKADTEAIARHRGQHRENHGSDWD